jgi:hypothetical protein
MDREPVFLYPLLEQRGFGWRIEEQSDGWFRLEVQKQP